MTLLRLCVVLLLTLSASADSVKLQNDQWLVTVDTATLKTTAKLPGGQALPISSTTQPFNAKVTGQTGTAVTLTIDSRKIAATFSLGADTLVAHFTAEEPGSFTWPELSAADAPPVYLLPMFEGFRIPSDDAEWAALLENQSPLDTTAGLSMPFFAAQRDGHTLTYLATNPFNNELALRRDAGKLTTRFTHAFTRNHKVKEYEVRITLGGPSDVEPARVYRRWLQSRGEFVSFAQKIAKTPDAAKLPGAAHVYLWGNAILSKYDFVDAPAFCKKVLAGGGVGGRLLALLGQEGGALLKEISDKTAADNYDRGRLSDALTPLLERADFYAVAAWANVALPAEADKLLKQSDRSPGDTCRLNALLLFAAFPGELKPVDTWGDGFSPKMVRRLTDAKLDRLWLGAPDWKGLRDHPDFTRAAVDAGYLVGPYDSYHSIHSPKQADTWETAQFDQTLYDSGPITQADGSKRKGFQKKGYILSPLAARPAVEARVRTLMGQFQCNSWFIDCDAFGEVFDDYTPAHPATQLEDMTERLRRMAWIRDTYGAVIGSEGGSSFAAGTIHFAHGLMSPEFGWGDPDLKDKKSPYFLGSYYPSDGPTILLKQVPMKPVYRRAIDPRFRVPLYQTALHDSIVTTEQWGSGSLKFTDPDHARELLELLYNVPPLYHLNTAEWQKHQAEIVAHYAFFSPLHREAALLPMTDWRTLTDDRLVQRTTFGDKLEMVVNFGGKAFTYDGVNVPKESALAHWLDGRKVVVYSPR